uniref:Uncharacterized protein n=1 Tax=Rhizophora mucronata TaxID=61149 RepID=A0A2P2JG74_RHIMU
MAAQPFLGSSS